MARLNQMSDQLKSLATVDLSAKVGSSRGQQHSLAST